MVWAFSRCLAPPWKRSSLLHFPLSVAMLPARAFFFFFFNSLIPSPAQVGTLLAVLTVSANNAYVFQTHLIQISGFAFLGSLSPWINLQDHPLAWHLKTHADYTWLVTFDACIPPGKASLFFDLSMGTWAQQSLLNLSCQIDSHLFLRLSTFYFAFSTQREGGEKGEGAYSLVRSRDLELSWNTAWIE